MMFAASCLSLSIASAKIKLEIAVGVALIRNRIPRSSPCIPINRESDTTTTGVMIIFIQDAAIASMLLALREEKLKDPPIPISASGRAILARYDSDVEKNTGSEILNMENGRATATAIMRGFLDNLYTTIVKRPVVPLFDDNVRTKTASELNTGMIKATIIAAAAAPESPKTFRMSERPTITELPQNDP